LRPTLDREDPRVLMLGSGWFPATIGGLERYYRALFEQLPEATGVVIGPAPDAPVQIAVAASSKDSLLRRSLSFWRGAQRAAEASELVDAHFALYAAPALLIGRLRGRPTVFHFHGPWAEENVAAGDAAQLRFRLRRAIERRALGHADALIVLSAAFRRVLVERYAIPPWEVHVYPPGVALDAFAPGDRQQARASLGLEHSAFVVVCARRLVPRMGIGALLDAWAELDGELPAGSTVLIVGDGPLEANLRRRANGPRLAGRVRLLGRVTDEQLLNVYRAADLAAVPSLAAEGFGLVVLEAAACGTPSLVSDVGGLPAAVYGLDPSLIVPADDTGAWTRRLRDAADGVLPAREHTRRFAEQFDWPTSAERHRALYRRVASGVGDGRPRVVYIDHVARLSGAELALLRLLPHLVEINAHVILGEDGPLVTRLDAAGVSVEVLALGVLAREIRKDTVRPGNASPSALAQTGVYVARLARRLRQLRPDLVHTTSLKSGVYGGLAARAAGVPQVWHLHDRIAVDYLPRSAVMGVRFLLRHLPAGLAVNSQSTLDTLGSRERGRAFGIVPNIVLPPAPHEPADRALTGRPTTFAMVGRISPWKGQDLFLRAFAQAFPGGPERAVFIGSALFGEEAYEQAVRDLAADLGLESRVEFRGFRDDIYSELTSVDVLVHASVIAEPFGQVVLEGMAAGLAVIAADEGGPTELIADGENGRLFASRDAGSLAAVMRELAEDPKERQRLGRAAVNVIDAYSPSASTAALMDIYRRVLKTVPVDPV
jgi:glycosyltransferase involved in cell wall biosynthesis